ncbi:DUF1217 domain-containing protein [Cuneatibacter sp. NSJ-177]|uniref:AvaI/BsoBI family type II restriction endonuclease n=1 Tax=Cuneatibacter sp. NSJ-177 TaxID=2931401 RepID=UPI001FCFF10D|nr:AvaI/BsoBI family type II restriction endonuclease [Cuneatibacter sp. NSJ-177]MCJ7837546.1 DUF1217 domain-containing protein [Cuneatibacter sp. NSJ-177]
MKEKEGIKEMAFNKFITSDSDLVTTHQATRAGFFSIALEKNRVSDPYVKTALSFKTMVNGVKSPNDLLNIPAIRPFLIAASGLSDKSLNYLDEDDRTAAIKELIDKFLKPAGQDFIDEVVYRYLLIKGDSVGGTMRNRIGAIGEEKLIRCILSNLSVQGITYDWCDGSPTYRWQRQPQNDAGLEQSIKALHWKNSNGERVLAFDMTIPLVGKNVDICLFSSDVAGYDKGRIKNHPDKGLMFGELKSGIDPAGADEHWKTGNTALQRIRNSFGDANYSIQTSFVGAAIEKSMAIEIYDQLVDGTLSNASNLHDVNQLNEYCNWVVSI